MRFYINLFIIVILTACSDPAETAKTNVVAIKDTVVANPEKKITDLNDQITKNPKSPSLYYQRAKYYMSIRDYNAALVDMSHVMKLDSAKTDYLLTLADIYSLVNKTSSSKKYLERVLKLDPKNIEALLKLSELYMYVKKNQESIDYANEALRIDEHLAKAYFLKGLCYLDGHDTTKAISSMLTATEQDPEYYTAYNMLGIISARQKNKAAVGYYDNAIRIDPEGTEALYNKGKFYQDMNLYDKAIETYKKLLLIDSTSTTTLYNLGAINFVSDKYKESIKYFSKVIYFNPKYTQSYYARGLCYKNLGDKTKAIADLKMAVQLNPEYSDAKNVLKTLEQ